MSMSGDVGKSVQVPPLKDVNEIQLWLIRFQAFAVLKGFIGAIDPKGADPNLPASDSDAALHSDPTIRAAQVQAKVENRFAFACLTVSMGMDQLVGIINKSKTTAWPNGLAWTVIRDLLNRYMPDDMLSGVEVRAKLMKLRLKRLGDPKVLFEKIQVILNQAVSVAISDQELIAMVLRIAPSNYAQVLTVEQRRLGNSLTLDDLEKTMVLHYRTITGGERANADEDEEEEGNDGVEIGLLAFTGKCWNCNKTGHRQKDCKAPKKDDKDEGSTKSDPNNKFDKKCSWPQGE